jgi:hypothetical protein
MTTIVEQLKEKYDENSDAFHIALLMAVFDNYGPEAATNFAVNKIIPN